MVLTFLLELTPCHPQSPTPLGTLFQLFQSCCSTHHPNPMDYHICWILTADSTVFGIFFTSAYQNPLSDGIKDTILPENTVLGLSELAVYWKEKRRTRNTNLHQLIMRYIIGFTCLSAQQIHYTSFNNLHHVLFKVACHYALHRTAAQQIYIEWNLFSVVFFSDCKF